MTASDATATAVVALGANLGDRFAALRAAVAALAAAAGRVSAVSAVYETEPVGGPAQPSYLNAVLLVETALPPERLLQVAQDIEEAAGRVREARWGPRTLDIDIVAYGGVTSSDPTLTLPHPRAQDRAFVLVPWLDVDPDAALGGRPVRDVLATVGTAGVRRCDELVLAVPTEPAQSS